MASPVKSASGINCKFKTPEARAISIEAPVSSTTAAPVEVRTSPPVLLTIRTELGGIRVPETSSASESKSCIPEMVMACAPPSSLIAAAVETFPPGSGTAFRTGKYTGVSVAFDVAESPSFTVTLTKPSIFCETSTSMRLKIEFT